MEMDDATASLLTLPTEARFMIFDHLVNCTGTISIFAQYELARSVNKQTINLLHVNRLIRAEVQEYFYKNQEFEFRSVQAVDSFVSSIGPYHASIIRHICLGFFIGNRKIKAFVEDMTRVMRECLPGIERVFINAYYLRGFIQYDTITAFNAGFRHGSSPSAGVKLLALLHASEKLSDGKVFYDAREMLLLTARGRDPASGEMRSTTPPSRDSHSWQYWPSSRSPIKMNWTRMKIPTKEIREDILWTAVQEQEAAEAKLRKRKGKKRGRSESGKRKRPPHRCDEQSVIVISDDEDVTVPSGATDQLDAATMQQYIDELGTCSVGALPNDSDPDL